MTALIDLKSLEGQKLLQEARQGGGFYQPALMAVFCKQVGNVNCGIQSSSLILGAREVGEKHSIKTMDTDIVVDKDKLKYTEANMFNFAETLAVGNQDQVNTMDGLYLDQVFVILSGFNKKAKRYYANETSVDAFRQQAIDALRHVDSSAGLIVNYHMSTLGQTVTLGHHSPLAAYHVATDRFLVLDVWGKTEECWATTENLYNAMNTVDEDSGKHRGYCIVEF